MNRLVRLRLEFEEDTFVVRQRARETGAALGLDVNDQVRVATAVSEIARVLLAARITAAIDLGIDGDVRPELAIAITLDRPLVIDDPQFRDGILASRRLLDFFSVEPGPPQQLRMSKVLPHGTTPYPYADVELLRAKLAASRTASQLEELRNQNLELVATLEELTAKQQELLRLNDELTETNQGVLAMYTQLSEELEETNRGVVALYADLDQRGVELRFANEAKSRFLASVSHELRSPINSMLALTRFLLEPDSEQLSPAQAHQIELIDRSGTEILQLVNELLDLAKAESGRLEPMPTVVGVHELLGELRATMRPLAADGVDIILDLGDPPASIETDPMLLAQLLRNLLTNALKYTERGEVRVTTETMDSANLLRILVADTGIGIAAEHQELVFEEFFQVAGPLQRASRGTGLGLAFAKRVTAALGGTLDLASELGSGSTFTLTLPIRWVTTPEITGGGTVGPEQIGTVLVVDDEASFRVLLRQMLQGIAGRVLEAASAESALSHMRESRPDLVLLDLRMPSGDGEQVLAQAGSDPVLHEIPIAVVTSAELDDVALHRLSPAFAVVSKTNLTQDVLLETVRRVIKDGFRG